MNASDAQADGGTFGEFTAQYDDESVWCVRDRCCICGEQAEPDEIDERGRCVNCEPQERLL